MFNRETRLIIPIVVLIVLAAFVVASPRIAIPNVFDRNTEIRLGLDLVGGVQALLEADLPADQAVDAESMNTARQIIENRVNGLGVNEAVVQIAGGRRIVVEIPGQTDPEQALAVLRQTGRLEFVDMGTTPLPVGTRIKTTDTGGVTALPEPTASPTATGAITSTAGTAPETIWPTVMTGADLDTVTVGQTQLGEYEIAFTLKPEGRQIFATHTANNTGEVLAIVLDKVVISIPTIQSAIPDGQGVITGRFTNEEANALAIQLRYGSLPVPLRIATSQTVGPSLGADSLNRSLVAGLIGLAVVVTFMGLYYRLPGLLADVALIIYAILSLALFKLIPITLTLPGIAGFVLSVGVAVDANILIFERLKEELRAGRTLRQAVDLGWSRAWSSIRDSNISTLITCAILYWFGNAFGASIVKGFSLTLAIGVGVSMFTAIIVTRTFMHLVLDNIQFKEHTSWFGL